MRKISRLAIALLMVVLLPLHAFAELIPPIISPHYNYTSVISADLTISGGKAECAGTVKPDSGYYASVRVVLYRSSDGSSWTEIASWSDNPGSSGTSAIASGSKSLSSGYKYKVTTFGTVKNSNGTTVESPTKSTSIKSY